MEIARQTHRSDGSDLAAIAVDASTGVEAARWVDQVEASERADVNGVVGLLTRGPVPRVNIPRCGIVIRSERRRPASGGRLPRTSLGRVGYRVDHSAEK
jgi:hypothetical protein